MINHLITLLNYLQTHHDERHVSYDQFVAAGGVDFVR